MEKTFCDVKGCGKEIIDGKQMDRYGNRRTTVYINGVPVRIEIIVFPTHHAICPDCAEALPALIAKEIPHLAHWEKFYRNR